MFLPSFFFLVLSRWCLPLTLQKQCYMPARHVLAKEKEVIIFYTYQLKIIFLNLGSLKKIGHAFYPKSHLKVYTKANIAMRWVTIINTIWWNSITGWITSCSLQKKCFNWPIGTRPLLRSINISFTSCQTKYMFCDIELVYQDCKTKSPQRVLSIIDILVLFLV